MNYDLEQLSAYLDGELSDKDAKKLESRFDSEPHLIGIFEGLKTQNQLLIKSVREIDDKPLPKQLEALLAGGRSTSTHKMKYFYSTLMHFISTVTQRPSVAWGVACTFALAIFVTVNLTSQGNRNTPEFSISQERTTSVAINNFLNQKLTGSTLHYADVTVSQKMTFIDPSNTLCKYYLATNNSQMYHGVACFKGSHWVEQLAVKEAPLSSSVGEAMFQPANDTINSDINRYLSENIAAKPLTELEEVTILKSMGLRD